MALVINTKPRSVEFAGNPMIIKAHTNLTNKTFLRIIAEVSVVATSGSGSYTHKESFTYSVAEDGYAAFNIAETARAALNACADCVVGGGSVSQYASVATYSVTLKELYLDKMIEITGDVNTEIANYTAVMGSFTDYELLTHPSWDVAAFVGRGAVLSRKPEFETVYGGMPIVVPVIASATQSMKITWQAKPFTGPISETPTFQVGGYVPKSVSVATAGLGDDLYKFSLVPSTRAWSSQKYIRSARPGDFASFLFLNGFGVLESITCLTRKVVGYDTKSDHYVEGTRIGQSVSSVLNLGGVPNLDIQLTSGLVSRAWADWFASEFLPSRKVWMLLNGQYVPVAVEAEGSLKLYDESRPDLCEVKFSARCAVKGSVFCTTK